MANWFCSVFNVVCVVKRLSSPRCISELIESAWVVIVPGQKMHKKGKKQHIIFSLRKRLSRVSLRVKKSVLLNVLNSIKLDC